jgi:AcrR family transcriptional regulator
MPAVKKRARSASQKAARRETILDAAARAFSESALDDVNLADIAADAGLTKAALYRYYRGKELLFLALYERELTQLIEGMQVPAGRDPATAVVDALLARPLFCSLSAILHTVLERRLEVEEALAFKRNLMAALQTLSKSLARAVPLSETTILRVILRIQQALIGAWHLGHPAPVVDRVLEEPGLTALRCDFAEELTFQVRAIVNQTLREEPA